MTPKKGASPPPGSTPSRLPRSIGPFAKPDPSAPLGQVGRRPTKPGRLLLFAAMYFVCGVLSFFVLSGTLGVVVGVVFIGVSLLWLRGAFTAVLRQQRERDS